MCDSSPLSPFAGPRATSLFTSDYSSKFSPGTRKNGFSQCNLKSASFWNEAQRDINDGKSMKTMNFDNRMRQFVFSLPSSLKLDCSCDLSYTTPKLGVWGCNFQSRHCRNALSFLEMLSLHNLNGVGGNGSGVQFGRGNFGSSQGERDTLKFACVMGSHEFGVIRPENDGFSHRLKQRSFRNELLGKSGRQSFQEPSSVYNSDCLEDKNGGIQFIGGTSEINQVTGNELDNKEGVFNVENSVLFDKVIADKKENGIEFGLVKGKGEMENKKSSVSEEMENPGNDSSLSDFDFLKLKIDLGRDKRTARTLQSLEEDDLVGNKGSQRGDLKIEGIEEPEERRGLRHGKQVLRRSSMLAKQVISMQSALSLGFVSQLWVDTRTWMVLLVEVRPSLLSGEMERFLLEDISQVGDVVLVRDETVLDNELKMIGLDSLVGYNVVTPGRRNIGKVRGYTFNATSGTVELLELDSFGISIIPASLVSTYGLFVDDVIEVTSDAVIVHGDATTRLQRLTKGFWDARAMDNRRDELEEYPNIERRHGRSTHRQGHRRNFGNRKFPSKMRGTEDDFDLPMDY